jgi:hypothetical protein
MATYVFVHGAFQGGWVWGKVSSILRSKKQEVYSPTLTGCGDRSHLLNENVDLHTYIKDWGYEQLEASYLPMVTAPEELAELLAAIGD